MAFVLIGCGEEKVSGPISGPAAFLSGLKPGAARLLLKELRTQGQVYGYDLYTLAEIRIEKDTVIEGAPAKAFTITASEFYPDTTYVLKERNYLVARGDSLNLYRDKEGNTGFLFGLVKKGSYDTARFSDKTAELVFPLAEGASWFIRPAIEPGWGFEKEWMGKENLEFEGREYACDVFILHAAVELKSWVASVGLLKAEIEHGPYVFVDPEGNEVDSAGSSLERYELLKLNPSAAEMAAAKNKYRSLSRLNLP